MIDLMDDYDDYDDYDDLMDDHDMYVYLWLQYLYGEQFFEDNQYYQDDLM